MEDKIEVNEYVRFNNGEIGKVIDIKENPSRIVYNEYGEIGLISDIVKHSKQLIDLIKKRDIVEDKYNTYEVAFIAGNRIYCNDYNLDDSLITLREQDIKAILTREQFEANCYKVGGKDEKI